MTTTALTSYKDACLEFSIQTLGDRWDFFYTQHCHPIGSFNPNLPIRQSNNIIAKLRNANQIPTYKLQIRSFHLQYQIII